MPESVFTHTIPELSAGGACCAEGALGAGTLEAGALAGTAELGGAGLLVAALEAAGVAAGVEADDLPAGAAVEVAGVEAAAALAVLLPFLEVVDFLALVLAASVALFAVVSLAPAAG